MSKKVLFIQHGEPDKAGLLGEVLAESEITMDVLHPYLGEPVPENLSAYDGLALGGGAQSAYEVGEHPYLESEATLVRQAAVQDKPVIGLCLGAQVMARALGAQVYQAPKREIGLFDVFLSPDAASDPLWMNMPSAFATTHWHGDTFDIPPGGIHLASSAMTKNQLFRHGRALYGLQFHLEMTPALLRELVEDSREYLTTAGVDISALLKNALEVLPRLQPLASMIFAQWGKLLR